MSRFLPLSLGLLLFVGPALCGMESARADGGYFSDGKKQLTFMEETPRTKNERIVLYSLFGSSIAVAALSTFYAVDSKNQAEKVTATQFHTGLSWTSALEDTRKGALRSRTIAQVGFGISGAVLVAGIVAYIVTEPEREASYQDWQTRTFASPTHDGFVLGQGWSF